MDTIKPYQMFLYQKPFNMILMVLDIQYINGFLKFGKNFAFKKVVFIIKKYIYLKFISSICTNYYGNIDFHLVGDNIFSLVHINIELFF